MVTYCKKKLSQPHAKLAHVGAFLHLVVLNGYGSLVVLEVWSYCLFFVN